MEQIPRRLIYYNIWAQNNIKCPFVTNINTKLYYSVPSIILTIVVRIKSGRLHTYIRWNPSKKKHNKVWREGWLQSFITCSNKLLKGYHKLYGTELNWYEFEWIRFSHHLVSAWERCVNGCMEFAWWMKFLGENV